MNYIINPMWFYWLSVAEGIKVIAFVFASVLAVPSLLFLIMWPIEAGDYGFSDDDAKRFPKSCLLFSAISVLLFVAFIFIPSRNTLIEMQIAKFATYENAEWTLDTIKSAVDYIVEAIGAIK